MLLSQFVSPFPAWGNIFSLPQIANILKHLFCFRYYGKHFMCIFIYINHQYSFYIQRNGVSESLDDLSQVTQPASDEARVNPCSLTSEVIYLAAMLYITSP